MVDAPSRGSVPRDRASVIALVCGIAGVLLGAAIASPHTDADIAFMRWINDPPAPLSWLLAGTNALLRPIPLTIVVVAVAVWIVVRASGRTARLEILRAGVIGFVVAQVIAQVTKRLTDELRPLTVIPDLDTHGYPGEPHGLAYPSAHTAVAVALVAAMWPWLSWPQRIVGAVLVALVMLNRMYIGAHWPVDLVGGAATGLVAASVAWLVARRWPFRTAAGATP